MAAAATARTLVHRDVWLPRLWLCGGGVLAEQLRCQGHGVSKVLWRRLGTVVVSLAVAGQQQLGGCNNLAAVAAA
jgi:hypothetical protein